MSDISTLNDGYTRLCRAVINNTFEDAYNVKYENDIRHYIDSGNLEFDCYLAKLAYDLVVNKLNEILMVTHENARYQSCVPIITNDELSSNYIGDYYE